MTLPAQRGEGEWMDSDHVYSPPALVYHLQSVTSACTGDIKAEGDLRR